MGVIIADAFQKALSGTFYQPPVAYERYAKVTGIAADYKFPGQISATAYNYSITRRLGRDDLSVSEDVDRSMQLMKKWRDLVALNPELEIVQPGEDRELLGSALVGAASQFNPIDIKFFIDKLKENPSASPARDTHEQIDGYADLEQKILERTSVMRGWVAAPETLAAIYEQVKDREQIYSEQKPYAGAYRTDDRATGLIPNFTPDHTVRWYKLNGLTPP